LACVLAEPAHASIHSMSHFSIDLSKPADAAAKASWSDPGTNTITAEGLGWGTVSDQGSHDFWLQTTEPFALGLSWRPTVSAHIRARVDGSGVNGQLYARYSADAKHWTTWQPLEAEPMPPGVAGQPRTPTQTFKGMLRVPHRERGKYGELLSAFSTRRDVSWTSDEEALVKDILKGDPKFFERLTPFVGYVQFLYEAQLTGGSRVKGLVVDAGWAVGGLHTIPQDSAEEKGRDGPWRFKAD
jgi:hypothetical protein